MDFLQKNPTENVFENVLKTFHEYQNANYQKATENYKKTLPQTTNKQLHTTLTTTFNIKIIKTHGDPMYMGWGATDIC